MNIQKFCYQIERSSRNRETKKVTIRYAKWSKRQIIFSKMSKKENFVVVVVLFLYICHISQTVVILRLLAMFNRYSYFVSYILVYIKIEKFKFKMTLLFAASIKYLLNILHFYIFFVYQQFISMLFLSI